MKAHGNLHFNLNFKLLLCVLVAFVISLLVTAFLHNSLSLRDADAMIDKAFISVEDELISVINERLLPQCMTVRERLDEGYPSDVNSLKALANELRVTEICVADSNGVMVAASVPEYLAHDGKPSFSFADAKGQANEIMELINGIDTEICQDLQRNSRDDVWRKYVSVWRPSTGGFVQIGCDPSSLRRLARSAIVDLFRNWRVGNDGGVVVTTPQGLVLSDYENPSREGMQWEEPDDSFFWEKRELETFPVYVMIPRKSAHVQRDVLIGATALLNACALILVAILVAIIISRFVRHQMTVQTAKELKMATEIQVSALPSVFPPYPTECRFDIWASMTTAKEVGGDFYDFYYIRGNSLFFLIADVSGKGVPAALFMMRAKTLIKGAAQTGMPINQVVEETNNALCENNASNMFVTLWAGELNVDTGVLTYVNAGHNPPIVRLGGITSYLKSKPSLALGAMGGIKYVSNEIKLSPDDAIYLYTDGITEQPNKDNELFGEERLLQLLSNHYHNQERLMKVVEESVKNFAGSCEQADDCTQLVLRFRGNAVKSVTHTYKPTMEDLAKATADLEAAVESVPMKSQMTLMVAADEIFANIVRYSGAKDWSLTVELFENPASVRLIFIDDGKPFDMLESRDPDTTLSAQERTVGGMGIFIVKKTMSPIVYNRKDGRNVLTLGLTIDQPTKA